MKAERETTDRLLAHFLADKIGATIRGPHLRRHPLGPLHQARRPVPTASFPPAPSAPNTYRYEEDLQAMVGDRTGEIHRLGDRVTVRLLEAAPVAGALRFELLSEGRMAARPQQRPSGKSRPERRREKRYGQRRR